MVARFRSAIKTSANSRYREVVTSAKRRSVHRVPTKSLRRQLHNREPSADRVESRFLGQSTFRSSRERSCSKQDQERPFVSITFRQCWYLVSLWERRNFAAKRYSVLFTWHLIKTDEPVGDTLLFHMQKDLCSDLEFVLLLRIL